MFLLVRTTCPIRGLSNTHANSGLWKNKSWKEWVICSLSISYKGKELGQWCGIEWISGIIYDWLAKRKRESLVLATSSVAWESLWRKSLPRPIRFVQSRQDVEIWYTPIPRVPVVQLSIYIFPLPDGEIKIVTISSFVPNPDTFSNSHHQRHMLYERLECESLFTVGLGFMQPALVTICHLSFEVAFTE